MGKFAGAIKARQSGGGNWWEPGKYRARIDRVAFIEGGYNGDSYVIECEVLESNNPKIAVGEKRSQAINMKHASSPGNIGSFVCVGCAIKHGVNLDNPDACEIDESDIQASYGVDQPFAGLEVEVEAMMTKTRAGGDFTKVRYGVPSDVRSQAA
jgi:hypothetical protein